MRYYLSHAQVMFSAEIYPVLGEKRFEALTLFVGRTKFSILDAHP
jgi:hypothetical protein